MRLTLLSLVLSAGLALPAHADETPNPDIQAIIRNQLSAFDAGDMDRAFTYASPTIHGIFGSAQNFGAMVQRGYPMVWKPGAIKMLELRDVSGALWQRVLVTDAAGASHLLDYKMIETPEGWQIDAVQLLPQAGVGA